MITNKLTLINAVESYMHRTDLSTGNQMETWLQLAEGRINERVRAVTMLSDTSLFDADRVSAGSPAYNLPDDYLEMIAVTAPGYGLNPAAAIEFKQAQQLSGSPTSYILFYRNATGNAIQLAPAPPEGFGFSVAYYAKPTPMAGGGDTAVSELLLEQPDLYLYGMLREGYTWARNAEMYANADGKFNELVEQINRIDERRRYGPSISVGNNQDFGAWGASNGGM